MKNKTVVEYHRPDKN